LVGGEKDEEEREMREKKRGRWEERKSKSLPSPTSKVSSSEAVPL